MPVDVREAAVSEGPALGRLRRAWWLERHPGTDVEEAEFLAGFQAWWVDNAKDYRAVVAEDLAGVVGMAFLAVVTRVPSPGDLRRLHGDLQSVYVLPEHRGHGLGSRLVTALVDAARVLRCDKVTVASGHASISLYQRLGFATSDRLLTLTLENPGG